MYSGNAASFVCFFQSMSVNKLFFSAATAAFFLINYTRLLPGFIKKKNNGSHLDVKSKGYVAI